MSDATGIPLPVIEPKRRSRLTEFLIRLVREKPLGTVCGMIILIWILVAIFADALTPYPPDKIHLRDRLSGLIRPVSPGDRPHRAGPPEPSDPGGSSFHPDRSVHHRAQYGDQYPDRRHFRIHWW